jgi:ADP-ribose pyrophosphatase YjhB (NUDIX family)
MEINAGLVVISDNKILLMHPKGEAKNKTWSIPKGTVEDGEGILETAIRETYEETGVNINADDIESDMHFFYYRKKNKNIKKIIYYFIVNISPEKIKINKNIVPNNEVDKFGFFTKEEAEKIIKPKQIILLKYLA